MRAALLIHGALALLTACSAPAAESSSPTSDDAGAPRSPSDAASPEPAEDASPSSSKEAGVDPCSLGDPPPGVKEVPMRFEALAPGDALPIPLRGGDPTGAWVVTGIVVYIPSAIAPLIDRKASTGKAHGWAVFAAGDARIDIHGEATAVVLGQKSARREDVAGRGAPAFEGPRATIRWACSSATEETVSYDVSGDRAVLVRKTPSAVGDVQVAIEAARAK